MLHLISSLHTTCEIKTKNNNKNVKIATKITLENGIWLLIEKNEVDLYLSKTVVFKLFHTATQFLTQDNLTTPFGKKKFNFCRKNLVISKTKNFHLESVSDFNRTPIIKSFCDPQKITIRSPG